jgi:hypothetical protein
MRFAFLVLFILTGCGASSFVPAKPSEPPAATAITLQVSPASVTVDACSGSYQFGTILTGTTDVRVSWALQEPDGGSITQGGVYTPPATGEGVAHVVATSLADTTKVAMATITVKEKVLGVAVTPDRFTVPALGQAAFTAMVTTSCGTFAAQ